MADGAHTIGRARCVLFSNRLTSTTASADPTVDTAMAIDLQRLCAGGDGNQTTVIDISSADAFDNNYFQNFLSKKGLLSSDQDLFSGAEGIAATTRALVLVQRYSDDGEQFFWDFGVSMVKMGSISPLTGSAGEIRSSCRVANKCAELISC